MKMSASIVINRFIVQLLFASLNVAISSAQVDNAFVKNLDIQPDDQHVEKFCETIGISDYRSYDETFQTQLKKYQWNDWVYYSVIDKGIESALPNASERFKCVLTWYILNKSGYDIRLGYLGDEIILLAYTADHITGSIKLVHDKKQFVALNLLGIPTKENSTLKESQLILNSAGKAFSFAITKPPNLSYRISTDQSFEKFFYDSTIYQQLVVMRISVNEEFMSMLENYPNVEWKSLFNTPLSDEAYRSLIPQLKELVQDADTSDIAHFIFDFVRQGFLHLDDRDPDSFGRKKYQTPEESLYYSYVDSEDKAILLNYLLREVLPIPVIVLYYPESQSMTVGVSLDNYGAKGPLQYKGKSFLICDPSSDEAFGTNMMFKQSKYEVIFESNLPNN